MFERGKILLVPFPFTDLSSQKVRPALILSTPQADGKDVVVAFISSVVSKMSPCAVMVSDGHPSFDRTGLKKSSLIRCDKLATLDRRIVLGELGTLPSPLLRSVDRQLRFILGL